MRISVCVGPLGERASRDPPPQRPGREARPAGAGGGLLPRPAILGDERETEREGGALPGAPRGRAVPDPEPWDAGSAKVLEALGFEALASSSGAFAFTLGRGRRRGDAWTRWSSTRAPSTWRPSCRSRSTSRTATGRRPRTRRGRSSGPRRPARSAARSRTSTRRRRLYELGEAVERVAAAAEAAARLGFPFTFTARAENHIRGNPDLDDTIARLLAYEAAGADVLYAPGLRDAAEIRAVCEATSGPVNVLAHTGLTMAEIVEAGAQRVSVGGSLAWVAIEAMAAAAEAMRDQGDFSSLAGSPRIRGWLGG